MQNTTELTKSLTNVMDWSELLSKLFSSFPQLIKSHRMDKRYGPDHSSSVAPGGAKGRKLLLANQGVFFGGKI